MRSQCSEPTPILCDNTTPLRGLCVETAAQCNDRTTVTRAVPKTPENIRGKKYSYIEDFLARNCYFTEETLKVDYDQTFPDGEAVPATFSCMTYNIWGLARTDDQKHLFGLRQPLLEKTIRESGADLLCLQEMSQFSYTQLEGLIREYPFISEVPYPAAVARSILERNRAVDTYFLSKYRPSRVTLYGLPGVLGYENCLLVIEFPNLVVFNLYNQAGSRSSPGQEHKWIHYSRCRYDILQTILDMIVRRYSDKSNIVCGDFNFHLDGSLEDWPEIEMLHRYADYGFVDTFRRLNLDEPGFTEDTDRNPMRWNQKLIEKHYRYDGILYRPMGTGSRWNPRKSILIGTTHECLGAADSKWFIEKMSEVKPDELDKLTHCAYNRSGKLLVPINASDHFGVLTTFSAIEGGKRRKSRKTRRKTRAKI